MTEADAEIALTRDAFLKRALPALLCRDGDL